ncbi:hypothetical protein [Methylobacterium flocculans]|uniref:hypothetical protein n=1 Tax=Methylobacterium flocculans TaxID=2984843 RepID=UPI0021F2DF6E|nr:hypothetical protein [Methylobacterium sp. FF17]
MSESILGFPAPIVASIITLVGAVLLAPLFTRFLAHVFEKKSRLKVLITAADIGKSSFLKEKLAYNVLSDMPQIEQDLREVFRRLRGYVNLNISNVGTTTVKAITLSFESALLDVAVQVGEEDETKSIKNGIRLTLGDIQPGRSVNVHIYLPLTTTDYHPTFFTRTFKISADQIDRVDYSFTIPDYLSRSFDIKKKPFIKKSTVALVIFGVGQIFYAVYSAIHKV